MDDRYQTGMTPPPFDRAGPTGELSQVALWSMILGILSFCFGPLGLVALILGIIGLTATTGERARRGLGFAIAGTALGAIGLIGSCLMIGILLPAIGKARQTARSLVSETQLRQIATGTQIYYQDTGQTLPENGWKPILSDFLVGTPDDEIFTSPLSDGDAVEYVFVPGDFAFDDALVMYYEDPDHSVYDGAVTVIFDGGTVERLPIDDLERHLQERGYRLQR